MRGSHMVHISLYANDEVIIVVLRLRNNVYLRSKKNRSKEKLIYATKKLPPIYQGLRH